MSPTSRGPQADPPAEAVAGESRHTGLIYTGVAVVGSLILVTFAYGAARWGSVDSASLLALVFGVLLVAFSVAAVFGVRSRVIAPFVVAALLLPWLCGAAVMVGMGQRVSGVFDALANGDDSALNDEPTADGSDDGWPAPDEEPPADLGGDGDSDVFGEYVAPPDDVSGAVPLGEPVRYSEQTGPDPAETADWEVTITEVECGLTRLPGADLTASGETVDALPRVGHEFCLITSEWKNVGELEAWVSPLGHLMVGQERIAHEDRNLLYGFGVMEQRGIGSDGGSVPPSGSELRIDVYEVPAGATPDYVWITRDQPTAVVALKS